MDSLAKELNDVIENKSKTVYELLSKKGKNIFFPKLGILAQTAEAKSAKINATIGAAVEDDGTPMRLGCIQDLVNLSPSKVFPYSTSYGNLELRSKWKEHILEKNKSLQTKNYSLPVVTGALTHGLSILGYLFLDQGDTVILSDLFWDNYSLLFKEAYGADLKTHLLFDQKGGFNLQDFQKVLTSGDKGKKIVLLNFPNNPTGYTPSELEAKGIIDIILKEAKRGSKLLIICDDAYFGLIYEEGIRKESLFSDLCDLHENILVVKADGPTKEDYVWGFRVGFLTYGIKNADSSLYDALIAKTAGVIRGNVSNIPNISQSILYEAYTSGKYAQEKQAKFKILKSRYEEVKKIFKIHPEYAQQFKPLSFNSGYFMCVKLRDGLDGSLIRQELLKKYSIGVIWLSGVIRVAFAAVSAHMLDELFENLYKTCKDFK